MMSSTVHLSDEAYALLKALKGPNESFSDVVMREIGTGRNPLKLLELKELMDPDIDLDEIRARRAPAEAAREESLRRHAEGDGD